MSLVKSKQNDIYDLLPHATGDGALSFSWVNRKTRNSDSNLPITQKDVNNFLKSNTGARYRKNYKVFALKQQIFLVKPVLRINENTLKLDDKNYHYELTENGHSLLQKKTTHLPESYIKFTFIEDDDVCELKNWNTLAELIFFLVNQEL
jgi:hypothetical protein